MKQRLSLRARALQLLAQREHSRLELRRKLLAHAERLARLDGSDTPRTDAAREPGDGGSAEPAQTRSRRAPPSPQTLAQLEALLDELTSSGTQSDARFVESRVRARAARQGKLRVVQELARHGLQLPADAARDLNASEFARAKQVWLRKFGAPAADAAGRARQMRFLAARGFSPDVVRRLLRGSDDDS